MEKRIEERKNLFYGQNNNISKERETHGLSLRKKKLDNNMIKKRFNNIEQTENKDKYKINVKSLNIKEEYKTLEFKTLKEALDTVEHILLKEENIDNIYFAIIYLQKIQFNNNDKTLLETNIPKLLNLLLEKYINDTILINEILTIIINITFNHNEGILNLFIDNSFLKTYNKILNKYYNDDIIFLDLIIIFGNLSCGNYKIQKLFYDSKIIEVLKNIFSLTSITQKRREYIVWFFSCFMNNIEINYYFKDNIEFFCWAIDFFCENIIYEGNTQYCLFAITNLSNIENEKVINYIISKDNLFNYILNLPSRYFDIVIKIISNISSNNENINLTLIKKYNICEFFMKGLNSVLIQYQNLTLESICNFISDENVAIKKILFDKGIVNKIFELTESYNNNIIYNSILCIYLIIENSDNEIIYILYKNKVIKIILEIISKNYDNKIMFACLNSISSILKKDNSNQIYKREFENYGIKELLNKIYLEIKDINLEQIIESLLNKYFNSI